MNYHRHYLTLIERARNRVIDEHTEIHHIVPRCMGGTDDKDNLVKLTPEEHYVAHQLLVKIYPGNYKLVCAAKMMTVNRNTNKLYGWIRRRLAETQSIRQSGERNSQYNTMWITELATGKNKKIKKNEELPVGWITGKINLKLQEYYETQRRERHEKQTAIKQMRTQEKLIQLRQWHEIYVQFGWHQFVEKTGYAHSKANLVQNFVKWLPEFTPQNGRKR